MAVKGFNSYTINQSPPKNSVLRVEYDDGSHCGYATCVRLFNNETGLLTASHVCDEGVKIVGKGGKIPLSQFNVLISSTDRDVAIYQGPPNWEGLLACKATPMITAKQLAKCKTSLFFYEDGWKSTNAEIVGTHNKFVSTLCTTRPGFSGTPHFNGKTVVGVHVGCNEGKNINLMAAIPPVVGLTTPMYVFETTAPTGRVYVDEEINELMDEYSLSEIHSILSKRHPGKDLVWENRSPTPVAPVMPTPPTPPQESTFREVENLTSVPDSSVSGNGKRGADRETTGKSLPPHSNIQGEGPKAGSEDVMAALMKALMSQINLANVEKEAARMCAEQTTKKTRKPRKRTPNKPMTSPSTSIHNTAGKYVVPAKRSQDSGNVVNCPPGTDPGRKETRHGVKHSPANTQTWRQKSPASGGPNLGPKRS
jgi:hypothetical protein